jgi:hypothetical protein
MLLENGGKGKVANLSGTRSRSTRAIS